MLVMKKKTVLNKNFFGSLSTFTFFYRYLFSKRANSVIRRVSFICFFGLMISIGSLLIVFNIMGGLGQSIKDRFLATEPHVIVSFEKAFSAQFIQEQKSKIENILKSSRLDSGVSSFYFFENVDIVIRTPKGAFSGAVARGYNSRYLESFFTKIQKEEALLSSAGDIVDEVSLKNNKEEKYEKDNLDSRINNPVETVGLGDKKPKENKKKIIMGLGLASELDLYEEERVHLIPAENLLLPPGEPVHFESARVESIVSTQNAVWNSNYIFYNREHFPSFREKSSYVSGFEIRLKDPEHFLLYKTVLEKEGFSVEVWSERNSSVFFALKLEKIIMSVFLSLAGLITLLAVTSLLVLLMVQKKREMGVLMAIGLPIQKIQSLFVGIGLFLCSFGMLGACLFSLFVCLSLKYVNLPFLSQFHPGTQFPVEFNFLFMLLLFVSIFFLAGVTCVLSVRSQSRYSPAELLKTVHG